MGFNLGLAAAAYQGVKAEQRRIAEDEFLKSQRDYTKATQEEHLSRRGYRDNAAKLGDEEVSAERALLPGKTALAQKQQGLTSRRIDSAEKDLAFEETRRPTKEKTATIKDETGLIDAGVAYDDAEDVRKWSPQRRKLNGMKIRSAIAEGALQMGDLKTKILGKTYGSAYAGKVDEDGIIGRLNAIADSGIFPELEGQEIADLELKGDVMEARDARGRVLHTFSVGEMKAAYDQMNQGETMTLADGANVFRKNKDGTVEKLTNNVKSFNPNIGLGGRGGGGTELDRVAASFIEDAKSKGKVLSQADAYKQVMAMRKSDPVGLAQRALNLNPLYQAETDPEKRQAMQDQTIGALMRMKDMVLGNSPGLSNVSPATQAKIDAALAQ